MRQGLKQNISVGIRSVTVFGQWSLRLSVEGQIGVHQEDQEWGPGKMLFQEVTNGMEKGTGYDEAWKNWAAASCFCRWVKGLVGEG